MTLPRVSKRGKDWNDKKTKTHAMSSARSKSVLLKVRGCFFISAESMRVFKIQNEFKLKIYNKVRPKVKKIPEFHT